MSADARDLCVRNVLDGIGGPSVFRHRTIGVVHRTSLRVVDDVFQYRAEFNGGVDFRFFFDGQIDAFCVAAAFDVEDTVVRPAMLVVSDQLATLIGGQGCLAGAREAKEQRHIFIVAFVGAAMHRQHALFGHQVIHDREDTLFHFTGVLGAQDHELTAFETEAHAGRRREPFRIGVGRELAPIKDDVIRFAEISQFVGGRPDQHVVHEQGVIWTIANNADLDAVLGVPAAKAIDYVQMGSSVEIVHGPAAIEVERLF